MHIPIYNLGLLRQRMFSWPKFWQVFFHRQIMKPRSVAASSLAVIIPCSQWVSKQLTISLDAPLEGHISANVANYQADISSSWVGRPYGSADIKTISSNRSHFLQGSCFFWLLSVPPCFYSWWQIRLLFLRNSLLAARNVHTPHHFS